MSSLLGTREFGFTLILAKQEIDKVVVAVSNERKKTHCISTQVAVESHSTAGKCYLS